jgi:hypothetical protein
MDEHIRKELRDYAWSYFAIHAEQRMKTFHFYLLLATLIAGGIVALTKNGSCLIGAVALAFLLPFLSFIFWKLEQRNKQLVKYGEEALMLIEMESGVNDNGEEPHRLKLFLHEKYDTAKRPRYWPPRRVNSGFSRKNVFV